MKYEIHKKLGYSDSKYLFVNVEKDEDIEPIVKQLVAQYHEIEKPSKIQVQKGKRVYEYSVVYYYYRAKNSLKWKNALTGKVLNMNDIPQREEFKQIINLLKLGIPENHGMTEEQIALRLELEELNKKEIQLKKDIEFTTQRIKEDKRVLEYRHAEQNDVMLRLAEVKQLLNL